MKLAPGGYAILEPAHINNDQINTLSDKVEETGKNLFFTLKGFTMYLFRTRYGAGPFRTFIDNIDVGTTDSDYGTLIVVPLAFILTECDEYTKWFAASCKGQFCTFFKTEEEEEIECVNGVLTVGDFLTLDTSQGYERDLEKDLGEGQRIGRHLSCYLTMNLMFKSLCDEENEKENKENYQ